MISRPGWANGFPCCSELPNHAGKRVAEQVDRFGFEFPFLISQNRNSEGLACLPDGFPEEFTFSTMYQWMSSEYL